jgi:hypothetical protein
VNNPAAYFWNHSIFHKYLITLYYAIEMTKGSDLAPRSNMEFIVVTCMMLFDLIVFSSIFGSIRVLVNMSNRKEQEF